MASDLLSIARSGVQAARASLDLTAQNIANAGTEGYVRRSAGLAEVAATSGIGRVAGGQLTVSGVRFDHVVRNADAFRQAEVRRTGSDLARADAEVDGLTGIEDALEQSGVYDGLVGFDDALQRLSADPTSTSLRTATLEAARTAARGFNLAAQSLDAVGSGATLAANGGVVEVNAIAADLGRINAQLTRAAGSGYDIAPLLDQRDALLQKLSCQADIGTSFAANGTVEVRIGGNNGAVLVGTGSVAAMAMTTATDGSVSFTVGRNPVTLSGGALAGQGQVLSSLADRRARLDAIAGSLMTTTNAAQANGAAIDGSAGQPLFSGTGSGNIAVSLSDPRSFATAPAGAGSGSRDPANLTALRSALAAVDPAGQADELLLQVSTTVASRTNTRDALQTVAAGAKSSLQAQAGVDLDQEAVNLIRFQQAFQASSRAMQVSSDIFDSLLSIR